MEEQIEKQQLFYNLTQMLDHKQVDDTYVLQILFHNEIQELSLNILNKRLPATVQITEFKSDKEKNQAILDLVQKKYTDISHKLKDIDLSITLTSQEYKQYKYALADMGMLSIGENELDEGIEINITSMVSLKCDHRSYKKLTDWFRPN